MRRRVKRYVRKTVRRVTRRRRSGAKRQRLQASSIKVGYRL